ncbi:hypothetical protein AB205_0111570 [Aquarana catesbeiana]|uniref:Uncharacterized protein n=1 Tax=Aquarana catesbeiana TaxID=8400 RepID=A0A2G9SKL1_AQUCT|nr:hypothetical protein AB205_0111570 [Aquarana catesbeiana]
MSLSSNVKHPFFFLMLNKLILMKFLCLSIFRLKVFM